MDKAQKNPIKCTVENCQYNNSCNCNADSIEINAMGDKVAKTSDGTSCLTFKNQK